MGMLVHAALLQLLRIICWHLVCTLPSPCFRGPANALLAATCMLTHGWQSSVSMAERECCASRPLRDWWTPR